MRELTPGDVDAFAVLADDIEADHPTSLRLTGGEFLEILALPGVTFLGAFDGHRLVAWSELLGRGLGTRMLGAALAGARDRHRKDAPDAAAVYLYRGPSGRTEQVTLLAEYGFAPDRYRFLMVADLTALGEPPDLPADLDVRTFEPGDSESVRAAHNRAFADYPNGTEADRASWEGYLIEPPHVRHHLSFVVRDPGADDQVAAYLFSHEYAEPVSAIPGVREIYLPYIGTGPDHRGRGLATALIAHALHVARADGYDSASLDVDAANPTGALGVYERAGFAVRRRFDEYALRELGAAWSDP